MSASLVLVVLATVLAETASAAATYTNTWAVEIPVAEQRQVDALARKYGFINKGTVSMVVCYTVTKTFTALLLLLLFVQVGILDDVYEFVLPEYVYQRKGLSIAQPYHQLTQSLKQELIVSNLELMTLCVYFLSN